MRSRRRHLFVSWLLATSWITLATAACTASAAGQGKDGKYACDCPTDHLLKAIDANESVWKAWLT